MFKKKSPRKSLIVPFGIAFFLVIIIGGALNGEPELLIGLILTGLFFLYVTKIYPLIRRKKYEKLHLFIITVVMVTIIFGIQYLRKIYYLW